MPASSPRLLGRDLLRTLPGESRRVLPPIPGPSSAGLSVCWWMACSSGSRALVFEEGQEEWAVTVVSGAPSSPKYGFMIDEVSPPKFCLTLALSKEKT